ncbi:hypothetical protein ACGFI4_11050 [Micromonospora carbonacea]|uniref:hypothetical protein n=1 Tax=Micromonospora carbonacea TaxID=47853 RepID=UPI00371BCC7E
MTRPHPAGPPDPGTGPFTRRLMLRIGGVLGLAATGAALSGAAAAAPSGDATPTDAPDPAGDFGRPPAADARRRQLRRGSATTDTTVRAERGTATGADPTSARGARLQPGTTTIDTTPLSRRSAPWPVED